MLNNRIGKKLFKSLLKWNRKPEVCKSRFIIDPVDLGIRELLPLSVTKLNGVNDVNGAIYHIFRNSNDNSTQSIDLGFKVLKYLNNLSNELIIKHDERKIRMNVNNKIAKFRIGQIVQHNELLFRGVVIGWDVDQERKIQRVEVLRDVHGNLLHYYDSVEFTRFPSTTDKVVVDGIDLKSVTDPALTQISNKYLSHYFDGYNSQLHRYIPNIDLRFWYAHDFERLNNYVGDAVKYSKTKDYEDFRHSINNTYELVGEIGKEVLKIMEKHTPNLSIFAANRNIEAAEEDTGKEDYQAKADALLNEQVICDQVLEDIVESATLCADPDSYGTHSASRQAAPHANLRSIRKNINYGNYKPKSQIAQRLRRGGMYRYEKDPYDTDSEMFYYYNGVHEREIERAYFSLGYLLNCVTSVDQLLQLRFQSRGVVYQDGLYINKQPRSLAPHSTSVAHVSDASEMATSHQAVLSNDSDGSSHCVSLEEHDSYSDRSPTYRLQEHPTDKRIAEWNAKSANPSIKFEVGQIVRHKQFPYRGVVCGVELRPAFNMSQWEGIANLSLGQEQPIYRIVPDEGDVEDMLGIDQFRSFYYVAQENLELITEPERRIVHHRTLGDLFLGYDIVSGRFRLSHKLRYCFPSGRDDNKKDKSNDKNSKADKKPLSLMYDTVAAERDMERKIREEQDNIYRRIDVLLVELLTVLRESFSKTRLSDANESDRRVIPEEEGDSTSSTLGDPTVMIDSIFALPPTVSSESASLMPLAPPANSDEQSSGENQDIDANDFPHLNMHDLNVLLRSAICKEHAGYIESALWLIWACHDNPDLNKLARLNVWHARRRNFEEAVQASEVAIELDPDFAEPYNKLASFKHSLGDESGCIDFAEKALKLMPYHFGSLTASAIAYEKLGNNTKAITRLRETLAIHPWAAHLPTILISIMSKSTTDNNQPNTSQSKVTSKKRKVKRKEKESISVETERSADK